VKAIAMNRYGGPEVLSEMELPDPKVGPDTVLVRVRTAGVNPVDWMVREGYLDGAFPAHFPIVPGWDVAGVIEIAGPAVAGFAAGDEVIGYARRDEIQHGTYAELVPAPERALARKPVNASWPEAGALPLAGLTAYQALKAARVGSGDTVLVHAAAGGVGHLAIQLAKVLGAKRVIGTASAGNHSFVRLLGAEPVIYGEGLVERVQELAPDGVDAVLDLVGGPALTESAALLGQPKRLVSVVDAETVLRLGGTYVFVKPSTADLTALADLVDAGRLTVHISQTFPLAQAAQAQSLVQEGHVRGKVVIEI
jgi:NADPH:quinone reductase-like Zn-dependent oxidoreductase